MFRLHDIVGEYFICKTNLCNQRVCGIPYDEHYQKVFRTRGDGLDGIARQKAHAIFDELWKKKGLSRDDSYKVLQKIMRLSEKEAHISKFSKNQCELLMKRLKELGDAALILSPTLPEELYERTL